VKIFMNIRFLLPGSLFVRNIIYTGCNIVYVLANLVRFSI
jgi:hypothetical protein